MSPQGVHAAAVKAAHSDDESPFLETDVSVESREEVAKEFEKVFVRQFVDVMTEEMFTGSLAGEGGRNWMSTQRSRQRQMMTDMITDQIVEAGDLQLSEKLLRRWTDDASEDVDQKGLKDPLPSTLPDAAQYTTDPQEGLHIDHAV